MKKANYELCVKDCTAALEIAPNHMKSLQRRAMANEQLKKYKEAQDGAPTLLPMTANVDRLGGRAEAGCKRQTCEGCAHHIASEASAV